MLAAVDRRRIGWLVRAAALVVTFAMAFYAFESGVGVSDRAGLPSASAWTHGYFALGLFVLGGLDLGMPVGGSAFARNALWVAYFVAPLITTSAVVEGVLRLMDPAWVQRRTLRDHVVIVSRRNLHSAVPFRLQLSDNAVFKTGGEIQMKLPVVHQPAVG